MSPGSCARQTWSGTLPGVELNDTVARAAMALHRDACRLLASARAGHAPELTVSGSGNAG